MIVYTPEQLEKQYERAKHRLATDGHVNFTVSKVRASTKQKGAMFLWEKKIAELLNDHGMTIDLFFKRTNATGADWTKEAVHEVIIKPIIFALFQIKSTTQLERTEQVNKLIEAVSHNLFDQRLGIKPPEFPSLNAMLWESEFKRMEQEQESV